MAEKFYKTNSYYEGLIQNLYGGSKGSFVLFMQFFYQYNQMLVFNERFCDCFEKLYKNELKNCQILSKILLKIGGDNKYYSSSRKFLSGYNVEYIKSLHEIFSEDIELLEISIIEAKNIFEKVENLHIRQDLKIVIENKKNSLKMLKENYFKMNNEI